MSEREPVLVVDCDSCENSIELSLTKLAGRGWDDRHCERELVRAGWREENGRHICVDCLDAGEEGGA